MASQADHCHSYDSCIFLFYEVLEYFPSFHYILWLAIAKLSYTFLSWGQ